MSLFCWNSTEKYVKLQNTLHMTTVKNPPTNNQSQTGGYSWSSQNSPADSFLLTKSIRKAIVAFKT